VASREGVLLATDGAPSLKLTLRLGSGGTSLRLEEPFILRMLDVLLARGSTSI
jgi:hypothetical protein